MHISIKKDMLIKNIYIYTYIKCVEIYIYVWILELKYTCAFYLRCANIHSKLININNYKFRNYIYMNKK